MSKLLIRKRGKTYDYRFETASIGGKRQQAYKGGFPTKEAAQKAGAAALAEYNGTGVMSAESDMSYADYLDYWYENYCKIMLVAVTCKNYLRYIERHIKPHLGHFRMSNLSTLVIQNFLNAKFNEGYSRNSLIQLKAVLSGSFRYAVETAKMLKVSPMIGTKLPSTRTTPEVATRKMERFYVPQETFNIILNRFPCGHSAHIPLLLGNRCGERLGEAFGVLWEDIDLEQGLISVNRQVQYVTDESTGKELLIFTDPKYESFRTLMLDAYMLDVLKRVHEEQAKNRERYGEYYYRYYEYSPAKRWLVTEPGPESREVFPVNVRECGSYVQPRIMMHTTRIIQHKLGIAEFNFHSLRHTHATMLLENGAAPKDVQHRLGHKSITVTMGIYDKLTLKKQIKSIEVLNSIPVHSVDVEPTEIDDEEKLELGNLIIFPLFARAEE